MLTGIRGDDMANLVFFDQSHTYEVDGEPVPSVSEVTRFMSREIYGDITQFQLDNAAERGTAVHKALEVLDKYSEVEAAEDIVPYIKAYLAFRKDHPTEWKKIEYAVCHPDKLYAGTLDRYGTVDGIPTLLDFKTTSNIDPAHRHLYTAAQNLYRRALPDDMPVEQILILQLKKDGTYKLFNLDIDDKLADACLSLHLALKKKKRKRKDSANDNS